MTGYSGQIQRESAGTPGKGVVPQILPPWSQYKNWTPRQEDCPKWGDLRPSAWTVQKGHETEMGSRRPMVMYIKGRWSLSAVNGLISVVALK